MNITEARALAAAKAAIHYSTNGGWKRYLHFTCGIGGVVTAAAYGSVIAKFTDEGIYLYSHGHARHITTREAMNYCLSAPGYVHSKDNVIYAGDRAFTDGMLIPYKGES